MKNSIGQCPLCFERGPFFVKKNFCLVARIVSFSFDTVNSSIFLNSEIFILTHMFTI